MSMFHYEYDSAAGDAYEDWQRCKPRESPREWLSGGATFSEDFREEQFLEAAEYQWVRWKQGKGDIGYCKACYELAHMEG